MSSGIEEQAASKVVRSANATVETPEFRAELLF
jgi:C4-type Zn-finger protein